jgi:hypothetical protein
MRRRDIFRGVSAAAIGRLLPAGILSCFPTQASSNPAAVMTALQIMGALSSLANHSSSGLAEQFRAINIKLDQVLDNQSKMMLAIETVQHSLDKLRGDVEGLLTLNRYRTLTIDIAAHSMRLMQFAEAAKQNIEYVKSNSTKRAEYEALLHDARGLVTTLHSTVNNTDLFEQNVGSKGLNTILIAAPAFVTLPHSLRILYSLEGLYHDLGWQLIDYQQQCKVLQDAFGTFATIHLSQVADYQINQAKVANDEWLGKFPKGKSDNTVIMSTIENSQSETPGDGVTILKTKRFGARRCYVSKQFRVGPQQHGLFYKNVFNVLYDQEVESVPFNWTPDKSIDAYIKVTPRPTSEWSVDWYDLEYRGFLADHPRIVAIGDRSCDELQDQTIGESAKKPYDVDADKKKVLKQFISDFGEATDRRNEATLQLIQVERVSKITESMRIYALNFEHKVSNYMEIDRALVDKKYGNFHWKPFDPKTEIEEAVQTSITGGAQ